MENNNNTENYPMVIEGYFAEPEYVVTDCNLIEVIQQLKEGEELWYRDYDKTTGCISIYKCVTRTRLCGQEVYVFSFSTDNDGVTDAEGYIVNANITTTYDQEDPDLVENCQDYALLNALQSMYEWTDQYHGLMIVEEDTYNQYFKHSENPIL